MRVNIYIPDSEKADLKAAQAAMADNMESLSEIVLRLLKTKSGYWRKTAKKKKKR